MEITEFKDFLDILSKSHELKNPKKYQAKFSETYVLIMNLSTIMTELTKSLIYKGINIYLHDNDANGNRRKITREDVTNNYYLKKEDIHKDRVQVLLQQLVPLNISVSITILDDINNISQIRGLTIACVGFTTFKTMCYYEEYFTRKNIVFYCINNSGIYGFFYNNLKETSHKTKKKAKFNHVQPKVYFLPQQSAISLFEESSLPSMRLNISSIKELSPQPYANSSRNTFEISNSSIKNKKHIQMNTVLFNKKEEMYLNHLKSFSEDNKVSRMTNDQYLIFIIYLIAIYYRKNVNSIHRESNSNKFLKKIFFINNYLHLNRLDFFVNNEKFQFILK